MLINDIIVCLVTKSIKSIHFLNYIHKQIQCLGFLLKGFNWQFFILIFFKKKREKGYNQKQEQFIIWFPKTQSFGLILFSKKRKCLL